MWDKHPKSHPPIESSAYVYSSLSLSSWDSQEKKAYCFPERILEKPIQSTSELSTQDQSGEQKKLN